MVNRDVIFRKNGDVVTRAGHELLARWQKHAEGGFVVLTAPEGIYGSEVSGGLIYAHLPTKEKAFEAWAIATEGTITIVKENEGNGPRDEATA